MVGVAIAVLLGGMAETAAAADKCQVKVDKKSGVMEFSASDVDGATLRWGDTGTNQPYAFFDPECVKGDKAVKCTLGARDSREGKTPPRDCTLYVIDARGGCIAWIPGCTPGVREPEVFGGQIGADEILDGAIGPDEFALGAVGAPQIANGAVGSAQLAYDAVGTDEIGDGAIGPADIAEGDRPGAARAAGDRARPARSRCRPRRAHPDERRRSERDRRRRGRHGGARPPQRERRERRHDPRRRRQLPLRQCAHLPASPTIPPARCPRPTSGT